MAAATGAKRPRHSASAAVIRLFSSCNCASPGAPESGPNGPNEEPSAECADRTVALPQAVALFQAVCSVKLNQLPESSRNTASIP
jgi:hypothetical protein